MERKVILAPGEYYHVYNRGVNKMKTFIDRHDYWRFIFLMYLCNNEDRIRLDNLLRNEQGSPLLKVQNLVFEYERGEQIVDIGGFCLMPNHFHMLVREKNKGGLSQFMLKLGTAYSMYMNKRHDRSGPLFCKPFKVQHATNDMYLKYLFAYIHLNPVKLIDPEWKENGIQDKKRAQKYLDEYEYSSYGEYTKGDSPLGKILTKDSFPHYFTKNADFKTYIDDWLSYSEPL